MHPHQQAFVELLVRYEVIRFGTFTLKSGRKSPYFVNAGQLRTGMAIAGLGRAYAAEIRRSGLGCDLVFGSVDTFAGRHELEVACRRYGIPYIDIGMDVYEVPGEPPRMAGQIILSMPGCACMWCLQFLDEEKLAREAQQYGDAGGRPQVVWPNGVLASTAVGTAASVPSTTAGRWPFGLFACGFGFDDSVPFT